MYVNDLSYDPREPTYGIPDLAGVRWAVQIFTTDNLYSIDPARVQLVEAGNELHLSCLRLSWAGQQQRASGRVSVRVVRRDGAWSWQIEAWLDEPIKVIKLLFFGLPPASLGKGWWMPTSERDEAIHPSAEQPLRWRYPFPEWLTPWACAGDGGGAVCLSVRDAEPRAKRLYVHYPPYTGGRPIVELACEEDARRWDGHFVAPEMRLRLCDTAEEIRTDFGTHLGFIEQAYALPRWEERADVPAWMRDIRLVVTLHGQHWTGYVFNTFDRMVEALRFVTRHMPGEQVLAYLPGWEGRYYYAYPFYRPGEAMGGDLAFRRLLAAARDLGVRIMPMFGANGVNARLYPDWERAAFRNRTGRVVRLVNFPDWDSDRAGEDDQVFLNPGEPGFRRHLCEQVSAAVADYNLDGVFLDTSACWFNDPRYNLYDGYRVLLGDLRERNPGLLIAGEGWWDGLLGLFPVNQSWLGVERRYRFPELLTRYGRALGHLSEGTPGAGSTGVHEAGFRPAPQQKPTFGHIASLGVVDDTLEQYGDEVAVACRAAAADPSPSAEVEEVPAIS
jgi:hypothetical protein